VSGCMGGEELRYPGTKRLQRRDGELFSVTIEYGMIWSLDMKESDYDFIASSTDSSASKRTQMYPVSSQTNYALDIQSQRCTQVAYAQVLDSRYTSPRGYRPVAQRRRRTPPLAPCAFLRTQHFAPLLHAGTFMHRDNVFMRVKSHTKHMCRSLYRHTIISETG
jgi:hypothetical protein